MRAVAYMLCGIAGAALVGMFGIAVHLAFLGEFGSAFAAFFGSFLFGGVAGMLALCYVDDRETA